MRALLGQSTVVYIGLSATMPDCRGRRHRQMLPLARQEGDLPYRTVGQTHMQNTVAQLAGVEFPRPANQSHPSSAHGSPPLSISGDEDHRDPCLGLVSVSRPCGTTPAPNLLRY